MDINLGLSAVATGVDTITATYSPAPTLVDKKILFLRTAGANTTTTPTFNPNGLGAQTITKNNGDALAPNELDGVVILMYDLANTRWELITPAMASDLKDAIYAANAPSGANVFATINDLAGYELALGFTPEDVANKSIDGTLATNSDTLYPSEKAVKTYTDGKVTQVITNGVTDKAPSEDAVFDALALKTTNTNLVSQLASYNNLVRGVGNFTSANTANSRFLSTYGGAVPATGMASSGNSTAFVPALIYITSSDYPSVNGLTPKLRIRANIFVNAVTPNGNIAFSLYPTTAPVSAGAAGVRVYDLGTMVSGSDVTQTAPLANTNYNLAGSDFALPADGWYMLVVENTATIATSSYVQLVADLQIRYTA